VNQVFHAQMKIPISLKTGVMQNLIWSIEVFGIPDLDKSTQGLSYAGKSVEAIGLLGRDLLRFARFQYDGLVGTLAIEFDLAAMSAVGMILPPPSVTP